MSYFELVILYINVQRKRRRVKSAENIPIHEN